jgi:hypothetical protein
VPPTCESLKSCTLRLNYHCSPPAHFDDEYGTASVKDEEARLDRISEVLTEKGSDSLLYIVAYAGRRACISEAQKHASKAKKYLIQTRGIEAGRIVVVDGGFRENFAIELCCVQEGLWAFANTHCKSQRSTDLRLMRE